MLSLLRLTRSALFYCGLLALLCPAARAQSACPPEDFPAPAAWTNAYPGYRVIGNLYVVGPDDLSVFLITTPAGHILINTGLEDSTAIIRDNMKQLGFQLQDVRKLLVMQSHFDHAAALAEIKSLTGAKMLATAKDARVLEDGGTSDPHFGACQALQFKPVSVDEIITDGQVITLGDTRLTVHEHPGHTEGSSSYSMQITEAGRDYQVAIVNMGSINEGKRLTVEPTYAAVARDFASTYRKQRAMAPDIWVAAHASQFNRQKKHQPGQPYSADTFLDPDGFLKVISAYEETYLKQIADEAASASQPNL